MELSEGLLLKLITLLHLLQPKEVTFGWPIGRYRGWWSTSNLAFSPCRQIPPGLRQLLPVRLHLPFPLEHLRFVLQVLRVLRVVLRVPRIPQHPRRNWFHIHVGYRPVILLSLPLPLPRHRLLLLTRHHTIDPLAFAMKTGLPDLVLHCEIDLTNWILC